VWYQLFVSRLVAARRVLRGSCRANSRYDNLPNHIKNLFSLIWMEKVFMKW
jgi:hypothetical protein